jgi:uncharacterized protein
MIDVQHGTQHEQLQNFQNALIKLTPLKTYLRLPTNWIEAFHMLEQLLQAKKGKRKKVIFSDEFSWINTAKSGFIEKFAHFWNGWVS